MTSLLDAIQSFNRRERHILVGWVLDRHTFPLGHEFRDALSAVLRSVSVPADAYVAMDYTLNWLTAALMWSSGEMVQDKPSELVGAHGIDLGDNSDVDLIVAFARGVKTHVVLLEAKGFTKWNRKQLEHKCDRLKRLFGEDGDHFDEVQPHWVFVSPGKPPEANWAKWMLEPTTKEPYFLPLPQPGSHKFAITRCDETGKKKDAGYWRISRDPWPS